MGSQHGSRYTKVSRRYGLDKFNGLRTGEFHGIRTGANGHAIDANARFWRRSTWMLSNDGWSKRSDGVRLDGIRPARNDRNAIAKSLGHATKTLFLTAIHICLDKYSF